MTAAPPTLESSLLADHDLLVLSLLEQGWGGDPPGIQTL